MLKWHKAGYYCIYIYTYIYNVLTKSPFTFVQAVTLNCSHILTFHLVVAEIKIIYYFSQTAPLLWHEQNYIFLKNNMNIIFVLHIYPMTTYYHKKVIYSNNKFHDVLIYFIYLEQSIVFQFTKNVFLS